MRGRQKEFPRQPCSVQTPTTHATTRWIRNSVSCCAATLLKQLLLPYRKQRALSAFVFRTVVFQLTFSRLKHSSAKPEVVEAIVDVVRNGIRTRPFRGAAPKKQRGKLGTPHGESAVESWT